MKCLDSEKMGKIENVWRTAVCVQVQPEKMPYCTVKSRVRSNTTLVTHLTLVLTPSEANLSKLSVVICVTLRSCLCESVHLRLIWLLSLALLMIMMPKACSQNPDSIKVWPYGQPESAGKRGKVCGHLLMYTELVRCQTYPN